MQHWSQKYLQPNCRHVHANIDEQEIVRQRDYCFFAGAIVLCSRLEATQLQVDDSSRLKVETAPRASYRLRSVNED